MFSLLNESGNYLSFLWFNALLRPYIVIMKISSLLSFKNLNNNPRISHVVYLGGGGGNVVLAYSLNVLTYNGKVV